MRYKALLFTFGAWLTVGAALSPSSASEPVLAKAELKDAEGKTVGVVAFARAEGGVLAVALVTGLKPGYHAFHVHGTGKCEGPDFSSAGGHYNPFGMQHGLQNPKGSHVGDMPNLLVGPDGTGMATALLPRAALGAGEGTLFPESGTAVVVHEGPDDHVSDPAGMAGGRVACGVIQAVK